MDEKELLKLFRDRTTDRKKAKTRRRKQLENSPKPLSNLISEFFKSDPHALSKIEQSKAILAWPRMVGNIAAMKSEAQKIRGKKLVVKVEDPMWRQQLLLLKYEILEKYRKAFPKLRLEDIFFVRT